MKNFLSALLLLISVAWGADAQAQGRIVSGFVSDDSGDPLIGVTVTDPGAQTVAISDAGGAFTIRIPGDDATLRFSYVGFQTQDIVVGGRSEIAVVMTADASLLEDVVVIGYGVQQKKLVTGATVQVSGDNVAKLNTVNVLGALQSQTPGVSITQASGMPGEGFKVFVRGMGTMGDASPLYVIDGVPGGDINNLNPGDIERIDVLKDAASAAIYGARAANGVILVTTKQGRAGGKAQISFDAYYGIQNVYRMPDLLNAQEYAMIQNEARIMDGLAPYDFATEAYGTDPENHWQKIESGEWNGTNWLDESRNRNAPVQNYTFNATGGSDMSVYSIGFGYTAQEGILGKPVQPRYERYTARVNSERTLIKGRSFDIIKLGENISYSYNQNTGRFGLGDMYYNDIRNMMTMSPFLPLLDEDGKTHYAIPWEIRQANPIALMKARSENMSEGHSLRANVFLTIQPIKNLIFKSTFGYSYGGGSYRSFLPKYELSSTVNNTLEEVSQSMYDYGSMTLENTLTYTFDINEDHHFTALLGQSIEKGGLGGDLEAANGNPIFHDFKHAYLDNAPWTGTANTATSLGGGPEDPSRWASFFGRVSYDYQNKYMATVILRADGSHNFMRGHRWGYFPSVSAGW
ncbi:MAG: SusC/RagA family TonB-linked outer membrane protein, partial [Alistipes sp.]|nr:SusC/RagA family TonB-linked outer membrane protein [Alistipes sp.]